MIGIGQGQCRLCDGWTRREFLRVGGLGLMGFTLADFFHAKEAGAVDNKTDKNCILLFLVGGPSHLDTWDLKPNAPSEIRGPFSPIKTNVPGIEICEHFPRMARMADKYALIRSVNHPSAGIHETGHQWMQTGHLFDQPGQTIWPHYGSVIAKLKGPKSSLPPFVVLPQPIGNTGVNLPHGQEAGFLGKQYEPLILNADPNSPTYKGLDIKPPVSFERLVTRRGLLQTMDGVFKKLEDSTALQALDVAYQRAFSLIMSSEVKEAFDLSKEPDDLRDKYGRTTFGQCCLLARRLIERGVRLVTVNQFETVFTNVVWDCHSFAPFPGINIIKTDCGPMFDMAFTALLEDLEQRGMLDSTLVVAMGEFGRTPKINSAGGRDHWPQVWTIIMAGCGIRGGQVVGSSDERGEYPKERPIMPWDVAATIYHCLGIDALDTNIPFFGGREVRILEQGEVIHELV